MRRLPRLNLRKLLFSLTPKAELPMKKSTLLMCEIVASILLMAVPYAHAQAQVQTTGTPGSPSATTTIPGNQLPAPPEPFGGVIKETAKDSTPYWPATIVPPKGAPNVLLIMTDDQGLRCFGHLWRRHPDARNGPRRSGGLALHPVPLYCALLTHACRDHYGPQPSLSRLWRDRRTVHRLPWLRFRDRQG